MDLHWNYCFCTLHTIDFVGWEWGRFKGFLLIGLGLVILISISVSLDCWGRVWVVYYISMGNSKRSCTLLYRIAPSWLSSTATSALPTYGDRLGRCHGDNRFCWHVARIQPTTNLSHHVPESCYKDFFCRNAALGHPLRRRGPASERPYQISQTRSTSHSLPQSKSQSQRHGNPLWISRLTSECGLDRGFECSRLQQNRQQGECGSIVYGGEE